MEQRRKTLGLLSLREGSPKDGHLQVPDPSMSSRFD
jgi:hypothetical protein